MRDDNDMSADDMLAEAAIENGDRDLLPPGYEDQWEQVYGPDDERGFPPAAVVTGRFCEPRMAEYKGTPAAEGRFVVARVHVLHDARISAGVSILLDDRNSPLANVAIYLSFEQAQKLAREILAEVEKTTP